MSPSRCARAASARKARKTSREPPPSRYARALGGTGWLAGWTPASLLVYPPKKGRDTRTRLRWSRGFGSACQVSLRSPCPSKPHPAPDCASLRRQCLRPWCPWTGQAWIGSGCASPTRPDLRSGTRHSVASLPHVLVSIACVARAAPPRADGRWGALSRQAPRRCRARDRRAGRPPPALGGLDVPTLAAPRLRPWRAQGLRQDAHSLRSGLCLAPQCWSCLRLTSVSPLGDPVVCARTPALRLP